MYTQDTPLPFEQRVRYERAEYLVELVFSSAAKLKAFLGDRLARKAGHRHAAA
ncbi:MAG TPA: hypothetical protein PLE54_09680 [Burkholderiaceae bacterium]|nr:hypothetical protein [Burkholderiaceae bacterium]HQR70860.1 hypothetical protein [Burkholderiaceae bacterium]